MNSDPDFICFTKINSKQIVEQNVKLKTKKSPIIYEKNLEDLHFGDDFQRYQ